MNSFVDYINSTNNVGGNSIGSLAESQVKSEYYDSVKVDRELGKYIASCVKSNTPQAFVLTGHAGDGKTSILVQVLKELGYLQSEDSLNVEAEYPTFMYAKDMSEITADIQAPMLERMLSAPSKGKTSLLISNTGPLLKIFEQIVKNKKAALGEIFTSEDRMALQSTLLTQLDRNSDAPVHIGGYSFVLVNIARVDNVPFAISILKNILSPKLWEPCNSCPCANRCPIRNNVTQISNQIERVAIFVENYYRFLYENDKRMTIRQMVGQISYAITGNLTCAAIKTRNLKEPFFNYSFANLFFGYVGLKPEKNASQIQGIAEIRNLALDRISLDVDYSLFVNQDFRCFTPDIQNELKALSTKHRKHYQITAEDSVLDEKQYQKELQLRCAIRRFYLLFSLADDTASINKILNQIFGARYTDYRTLILSKQGKTCLNRIRNVIFEALYIKNTGFLPNGKTELPLTLRREDDVFQSVMIVLGEVNRSDISVIQKLKTNRFEDIDEKYEILLRIRHTEFPISLPMINYFNSVISGAIASSNNPALSHGIAQLDAILFEQFGAEKPESEEECELTVVINTTKGQEIERFAFDGNHLCIQ